MERRKFITSGIAISTIPAACATSKIQDTSQPAEITNELYEWRTYDVKWGGGSLKKLTSFLSDTLKPAMLRAGANHFMLFEDIAPGGPKKIYALISYPDPQTYVSAQNLQGDAAFVSAATDYNAIPADKPVYNRFTSSLMNAFDGMKQMMLPKEGATVFELRIYESYSEDSLRRKIKMFHDGEIPLFIKVGLTPIFFGEMISGPYRPCLVYMINCTDMDEHAAGWQGFSKAPEWAALKDQKQYANSVSNIRNMFLKQL